MRSGASGQQVQGLRASVLFDPRPYLCIIYLEAEVAAGPPFELHNSTSQLKVVWEGKPRKMWRHE